LGFALLRAYGLHIHIGRNLEAGDCLAKLTPIQERTTSNRSESEEAPTAVQETEIRIKLWKSIC
jgi:hypothetical protein